MGIRKDQGRKPQERNESLCQERPHLLARSVLQGDACKLLGMEGVLRVTESPSHHFCLGWRCF